MRTDPYKQNEEDIVRRKKLFDRLSYAAAIIVAGISVYYFFIKLVFL